jgi:hypothetical protein
MGMTYVVTWSATALSLLARVAATFPDPGDADREAVWMDSILRRFPANVGESRFGRFRVWYGDVIGIWYRVDDVAMTVTIISAGPARRH